MKRTKSLYEPTIEKLKARKKMLTTKDFIAAGIPSIYLSRLLKNNEIERLERGIYRFQDGDYDLDYCLYLRYPKIVYSGLSALFFRGLSDRLPSEPEVTLPCSYNSSRFPEDVMVKKCSLRLFPVGISTARTFFGNEVPCYDLERTVIDLIRRRKRVDPNIYGRALRLYMSDKKKDLTKLMEYARLFAMEKTVYEILELLNDE